MFSPVLTKLGYGFDWSKGVVMWWGALRGAVSLALALLVAEDDYLDPHLVGSKVSYCFSMTYLFNLTTTTYNYYSVGLL